MLLSLERFLNIVQMLPTTITRAGHVFLEKGRTEFVEFIIEKNSKLRKLVNMIDNAGDSALPLAVEKSNPGMVSALLDQPDIDITVINKDACTAIWKLYKFEDYAKTINWVRTHALRKLVIRIHTF